jgi:hypothetical protein
MQQVEAIASFFKRLEELDIPFMVGGSLASSAHGNPRQTNDIDIVIRIGPDDVDRFVEAFYGDFMVSRQSLIEALESDDEYRSFQISHFDSPLRVDCFVPVGTPYQLSEFSRRVRLEMMPGVTVPVSSAEDIVLRKIQWYLLGGRVSDRQWNDIVGVLDMQHGRTDDSYLDSWATRLGIKDVLEEARSQVVK